MKKSILILSTLLASGTSSFAQTDSAHVESKSDTIRIGGMIILKKDDPKENKHVTVTLGNRRKQKDNSNISTASWIVDIGFSNWIDKTNYASATANGYLVDKPNSSGLVANDFKLRTIKSVNVNIWFFMQRLNLIKHYVNLKYGLGVELNNYRFKSNVSFNEGGTNPYNPSQMISHPFIFRDSISFSKNKLAADYVTIPMMLNFRTNKNYSKKGISLSAGVSAGYLYSSRNKQKSSERGKHKNRGDYDLEKWKFSYIAELGLGPAHLYGSYSPKSIFQNGLDYRPYNIGIRLSNW
ncbi:MAG: outer membrane beta-barrel protein [Bacteroidota bacterium]|nr:outer membrane beta-barrel protein [Bacteroidota bacterium]